MKVCAGAFLVQNGSVLLGLRSAGATFYPGVWDAIGGHVEPSETPIDALRRELAEEIQVVPTEVSHIATLTDPSPTVNGKATYHIFVVTQWHGIGPAMQGSEHSEIRWVPITEAVNLNLALPVYAELLLGLVGYEGAK